MPLDLDTLEAAIQASWRADTSDHPETWSADNPAKGQCAVTAKVVQDYFGGTLHVAPVLRDGQPVEAHCWNVLPDGSHVDLTRDQFDYEFELGEPAVKEPIVDHTGIDRHLLLAGRVAARLKRRQRTVIGGG